jgi:hypothetical protein
MINQANFFFFWSLFFLALPTTFLSTKPSKTPKKPSRYINITTAIKTRIFLLDLIKETTDEASGIWSTDDYLPLANGVSIESVCWK